jgi:hypothetical protein
MSRKWNAVVDLHSVLLHFAEGILISPKHNIIFCRKCTNFFRNVIEYTVYIYYYVLESIYQFLCDVMSHFAENIDIPVKQHFHSLDIALIS